MLLNQVSYVTKRKLHPKVRQDRELSFKVLGYPQRGQHSLGILYLSTFILILQANKVFRLIHSYIFMHGFES